jgi:ABC-type sulfate transport system permease subunit
LQYFSKIIVDCLCHIVTTYALNQSHNHWLLSDALHFAIPASLKFREKFEIPLVLDNMMDDDIIIAIHLTLLVSNIKKKFMLMFGIIPFHS